MLTATQLNELPAHTELRMTRRGKTIPVFLRRNTVRGVCKPVPADGAFVAMHFADGAVLKAKFSELSFPS